MAFSTRNRDLNLTVRTKHGSVASAFRSMSRTVNGFSRTISRSFAVAGAAVGATAVGLAAGAKGAWTFADAASDLREAQNKSNQVFQDGSSIVQDFARTSATTAGISKTAATEVAGAFGQILTPLTEDKDALAEMSVELVNFAGDLASFNNLGTDDALNKVFSGLAGEIEPMRRIGFDLSAATIEALLLAEGIAATKDEITQTMMVEGRLLQMRRQADSFGQTGDYERTSGELAGQQRTLMALWEDLKAAVGEPLRPIFQNLFADLIEKMPDIEAALLRFTEEYGPRLQEWASETGSRIGTLYDNLVNAKNALTGFYYDNQEEFDEFRENIDTIVGLFGGLATNVAGGLWDFITENGDDALTLVNGFADWVEEKKGPVQTALEEMGQEIENFAQRVWNKYEPAFEKLNENKDNIGSTAWEGFLTVVSDVWDIIESALTPAIEGLYDAIEENGPAFRSIGELLTTLWEFVKVVGSYLGPVIEHILMPLLSGAITTLGLFAKGLSLMIQPVVWLLEALRTPIELVITFIGEMIEQFNRIHRAVAEKLEPIVTIVDAIKSSWEILGTVLRTVYDATIGWVLDQIKEKWDGVKAGFTDFIDSFPVDLGAMWETVKTGASEALDVIIGGIVDFAEDAGVFALQAGVAMVNGVITGINSGAGLLNRAFNILNPFGDIDVVPNIPLLPMPFSDRGAGGAMNFGAGGGQSEFGDALQAGISEAIRLNPTPQFTSDPWDSPNYHSAPQRPGPMQVTQHIYATDAFSMDAAARMAENRGIRNTPYFAAEAQGGLGG